MSDNQDTVGISPVPSDAEGPSGSANASAQEQPDYTPPSVSKDVEVPAVDEGDQQQAQVDASETEEVEDTSVQRTGMTDVFSEEYTYLQPKRGEIRQAQVIAISGDGVMVDLGLKREGLIPGYDLQRVGSDTAEALSVGDDIPVFIIRPEDREGNIVVSWYRARQEQDWLDAQQLSESGEVWEGKVKGYNRGGLIVPFGKIRGFVPASHVTGISRRMDHATLQARLEEKVGQSLPLKVIEVNRQNRRLIMSERVARRQWRAKQRERLLAELKEGDVVHGVVSNICDFGAFVDIGGTDGLVHISEISWRRTNHPSEVLSAGQEVDAYVLRIDRERRRIGLSLRLLEPDPWESAEANYHVGQLVTGTVTKLTDFGAFAALEDGIEGLIHISELAEIPPKHPSEVVARGAEVPLLVVKVDSRRRRMGLSLKRVSEDEWYQWEEERRIQAAAAEPEPEEEALMEEPASTLEVEAEPVESAEAETIEPLADIEAETTEPLADAEAAIEVEVEVEAEEVEPEAAVITEELQSSDAADTGESQPLDETVASVAEAEEEADTQQDAIGQELAPEPTGAAGGTE